MSQPPSKVLTVKTPTKVIVGAVLIGLGIFAFVLLGILGTGGPIIEARKRGEIIGKEFIPEQRQEEQITLEARGGSRAGGKSDGKSRIKVSISEGEYVLLVEVPKAGGHPYRVSIPLKKDYDRYKVGDTFDVGPYLSK